MISGMTVKNFRCLQDFTLEDIRPITLIAGANNVGKSTILESLFLLYNRYSSDIFQKLNGLRGISQSHLMPNTLWEPLFTGMNMENMMSISISTDTELQAAIFSRADSVAFPIRGNIMPLFAQDSVSPMENTYPLRLNYEGSDSALVYFVITERGVALNSQNPVKPITPYIHYISPKLPITHDETVEWFGKVEFAGKKAKYIEILNSLDSRVRDLSVIIIDGIADIFVDLGLTTRLPINYLGDGILKLMQIALVMLSHPGAIILIDEIENGFHYSFYPVLWETIGKLSADTKCQVFATTHSYECINGASILINKAINTELFRFVRIDQNAGVITPHSFENDSFECAVKNNWEIR